MTLRFVVLSMARSGTSLLTSTIGTHPSILCHGEIFHSQPTSHVRGTLKGKPVEELLALQKQADYLEIIYNQDAPVVGHKMWRSQNPEACDKLMSDETIYKIIYERENALAQHASVLLARKTGVWNRKASENAKKVEAPKLRFEAEEFDKFMSRRRHVFNHYRKHSVGPVLNLTYREIVGGRFDLVLDFLKLPVIDLQPQKSQLHSSDILSRFDPADHDLIRQKLAEHGKPEWTAE